MNFLRSAVLLVIVGCNGQSDFTQPMTLGGQVVQPATLNAGREAFMLYCYACHGEQGKGDGPSSPGLRPPPRDFTQGVFKFGGVKAGELPSDEALLKTIRHGLNGTPMLSWDIPEVERQALVQYIKTLSPRWQSEKPGTPIEVTADPWQGKTKEAIEQGNTVYHMIAQCKGCHPAYATKAEMATMATQVGLPAPSEFPADGELYRPTLRESQYQVGDTKMQILPIDFLAHKVKSALVEGGDSGVNINDLYVAIAAGIGGTAMPAWKGALPEDKLWALVHYVKWLVDARDTPAAAELRNKLQNQPAYVPPAPSVPADPAATPPQ